MLLFALCLPVAAAAPPVEREAARLLRATQEEGDAWFDVQSWTIAEALPTAGFEDSVAMEDGRRGSALAPFADGVDEAEWAALRLRGAASLREILASADCAPTGEPRSILPSAHPAEEALFFWPERATLAEVAVVPLRCENPEFWPSTGEIRLPAHVASLALTRSGARWRVAGVVTKENGSLWEAFAAGVLRDVVAEEEARRLAVERRIAPSVLAWTPPTLTPVTPARGSDLNADGRPEVLLPELGSGRVGIIVGGALQVVPAPSRGDSFGREASVAGDIDGDGFPDLAIDAPGRVERGDPVAPGAVWLLRGGPGFDPARPEIIGPAEPDQADFGLRLCAPGDLDGDGRADLVIQSLRAERLYVYFGGALDHPGATIAVPRSGVVLSSIVPAGDLDGDGRAELWLDDASAAGERMFLLWGGPMARLERVRELDGVSPHLTADLDGDGQPELVGWERGERGTTTVFERTRDGWARTWRLDDFEASAVTAGDLDGDGRLELALGNAYVNDRRGEVRIYDAEGRLLTKLARPKDARRFGASVAIPGDLDGDGRADLVVGWQGGAGAWSLGADTPSTTWTAGP